MKKKSGFTLVELLAVIVVLALIMVIAIPSVLKTMNNSKKDTFYLYTMKLMDKALENYISTNELDVDGALCQVYDIKEDLDLSTTDNYDGWVKVEKTATMSDVYLYTIDINSPGIIQIIHYCSTNDKTCEPSDNYYVSSDTTTAKVTYYLNDGYTLCANYEYLDGEEIKTSDITCTNEGIKDDTDNNYVYNVYVTLTNNNYSIEDALVSENYTKDLLYAEIDAFSNTHESNVIASPICSETDTITYKGVGTKEETTTKKVTTESGSTDSTTVTSQDINNTFTTNITEDSSSTFIDENDTTSTLNTTQSTKASDETNTTQSTKASEGTNTTQSTKASDETNTTQSTNNTNGKESTSKTTKKTTSTTHSSVGAVITNVNTSNTNDAVVEWYEKTTTANIKQSGNSLLKDLIIDGYDIDFKSQVYYYIINVPYGTTDLSITATPLEKTAKVNIQGNENFQVGSNVITITSTFNSETSTYNILVNQLDENNNDASDLKITTKYVDASTGQNINVDASSASLSTLRVDDSTLNFKSNIYNYDILVGNVSELQLYYDTTSEYSKVYVNGNNDIENGSQVVISVVSENGYYTKDYTLNVHIDRKKEIIEIAFKISIYTLFIILNFIVIYAKFGKEKAFDITKKKHDDKKIKVTKINKELYSKDGNSKSALTEYKFKKIDTDNQKHDERAYMQQKTVSNVSNESIKKTDNDNAQSIENKNENSNVKVVKTNIITRMIKTNKKGNNNKM